MIWSSKLDTTQHSFGNTNLESKKVNKLFFGKIITNIEGNPKPKRIVSFAWKVLGKNHLKKHYHLFKTLNECMDNKDFHQITKAE